jgi:hypothetical protein
MAGICVANVDVQAAWSQTRSVALLLRENPTSLRANDNSTW